MDNNQHPQHHHLLATVAVLGVLFSSIIVITTMTTTTAQSDRTFQSEEDGYRLQIPQGWVIQDDDIMSDPNIETIAILCLENEALPAIGGGYNCEGAALTDMIWIDRWSDLQSRPEFENITSGNITTNDLLALRIQYLTNNASVSEIKIENSTDLDQFTKLVNMTYKRVENAGTFLPFDDYTVDRKSSQMYVLSPDRNTGYDIVNNLNNTQTIQHSPAVQEVFNSFEIVE